MPEPLKDHPGMPILQVRAEQPLPVFDILLLRPLIHGFLRHNELRAARRGDVLRHGDAEPGVPVVIYSLVDRGLRTGRDELVGFVFALVLGALLLGEVYVLVATETHNAIEVLVAARADRSEVQVVDFGRRVGGLVPGGAVAVAEGDDVGEGVVVVDDEGEVAHRFVPVVCWYGEGATGVGVFGDDVWVFDPVFMDVLHPLNDIV